MASLFTIRHYLLVTAIICTVTIGYTSAKDDYEPDVGHVGEHPYNGHSGHDMDSGPEEGGVDPDHDHKGGDLDPYLGGEDPDHGQQGEDPGPYEGGEDPDHDHKGGDLDPYLGGEDPDHGQKGEDPGPYEGGEDPDHGHEVGADGEHEEPPYIFENALHCLEDKHLYQHCEETFRLTLLGELHVPHDQVDEFCSGPCFEETNLVLHCIDGILEHFKFHNKATTEDVRDTLLAGCGHGDERGDFNVEEHIQDYGGSESIGRKCAIPALVGIVVSILGQNLLL